MSKERYPLILSRDWQLAFGDLLTPCGDDLKGEFVYHLNHTERNPRLNWSLYSDQEERTYLVIHFVDTRGDTLYWDSLPMRVTRNQVDELQHVDGHDINIRFLGTRRMSNKFDLAATIALHRGAITGNTVAMDDILAKAQAHIEYMSSMSTYFERYMSKTSAEVSIMSPVDPCGLMQWEY